MHVNILFQTATLKLVLLKTDPMKKCPHCHKEFVKKFQKIGSIQGKGRLKIQLF